MSDAALAALENALSRDADADDLLRSAVAVLASHPALAWAGIAFREEGELVLGPEAGRPDAARRTSVPVLYEGVEIGELRADGDVERTFLEHAADLVSPYVLIGWDTGGAGWEP